MSLSNPRFILFDLIGMALDWWLTVHPMDRHRRLGKLWAKNQARIIKREQARR